MLGGVHRLMAGAVIFISLIGGGFCYGEADTKGVADSSGKRAAPADVGDRVKKAPADEDVGLFDASGLVEKIGKELHDIAEAERSAAFKEIDRERRATLDYLTRERRETMMALEAIGNRVAENAILKSERLIDHFFVRILQLMVVTILAVCVIGLLFYRTILHRKNHR